MGPHSRGLVAGRGTNGVQLIELGIDGLARQGALVRMPYWLSLLADTLPGRDAARQVLEDALEGATVRDEQWWAAELLRQLAACLPGPEGVEVLRRGLETARDQQNGRYPSSAPAGLAPGNRR